VEDACYCDFEPWDAGDTTSRKARLTHRCNECGGTILPGEVYEYTWSVYDGDFNTHKMCPRCVALRKWVQAHVPCFCWYFEYMLEHGGARDTLERYAHEAPGLMFGYGRLLVALRRFKTANKGKIA